MLRNDFFAEMIKNTDHTLLQDLITLYTNHFGLSPIMAKICAYLKLDFEGNGATFDQLQQALGVSKGSISMNLRKLIDKGIILEINKFNERKTYFVYNQDYIILWLKQSIERMEYTLSVVQRVNNLSKKHPNTPKTLLKRKQIHQEFLQQGIEAFKETLFKIENV
ncbi:DNA-binding protein [Capnocytophaga canis]|uniref:DNA-binding protein n=2 Tax=Capnocytophaga TaxID=1016 RepID=A0A0B7HY28_9FLAO|nr:DNA-binding protein [Capnocytophaga canis]